VRLLLVRLSALGDVVHTLPALELLRAAAPAAEIGWVVEAEAAPLLEGHPALDALWVLDRRALGRARGRVAALRRGARALRGLRAAGWDAALDLQGLLRSALVARAAGARRVLGPAWAREGARLLYGERLAVPAPGEAHAVDRAAAAVRLALARLGAAPPPPGPPPAARLPAGLAAAPPDGGAPRLVLLPGAGKPANRPPPALLAEVADRCAAARPDLEVWLVGGPGDRAAAAEVAARTRRARPRSAAGERDLAGSAALLAGAAAVVGGDTGPLHLARALGRPVVGLFHAADPARTGPGGLPGPAPARALRGDAPCAPCLARRCRRPDRVRVCLDALPAERVAAAVLDVLEARAAAPRGLS